jgi:hypothetical protein
MFGISPGFKPMFAIINGRQEEIMSNKWNLLQQQATSCQRVFATIKRSLDKAARNPSDTKWL